MAEHKFNPNEHLIQIGKGNQAKDYLPVQWRLVWFREVCPDGTIDTEEKEIDLDRETEAETAKWNQETRRMETTIKRARGYARFRAVVENGTGGRATGTKQETAANFPDFVEKSETGAIGRALAALGYGTQFTDEEFCEGERLADAPVTRQANASATQQSSLEKKRATARRMASALGLNVPLVDRLEEAAIDNLISQYKQENMQRQQSAKQEEKTRAEIAADK